MTELTFPTRLQAETFLRNASFRPLRPNNWLRGTRAAASVQDDGDRIRLVIVERRNG
jgi:hypothetical protein